MCLGCPLVTFGDRGEEAATGFVWSRPVRDMVLLDPELQ